MWKEIKVYTEEYIKEPIFSDVSYLEDIFNFRENENCKCFWNTSASDLTPADHMLLQSDKPLCF